MTEIRPFKMIAVHNSELRARIPARRNYLWTRVGRLGLTVTRIS
jgi:hypothetical protein